MRDPRVEQWLNKEGVEWRYEPDIALNRVDREASLKNQARFKAINQDQLPSDSTLASSSVAPRDIGVPHTHTGMRVICPNCQHRFAVRSSSGRKPLNIPFINICEALQRHQDVRAAAESIGCSVGYIYKVLGQRGRKPGDVINHRARGW